MSLYSIVRLIWFYSAFPIVALGCFISPGDLSLSFFRLSHVLT